MAIKKRSKYGLKWKGDGALEGDMPEEKFRELVAKLSATEQELFPGEQDVLEITTFEKLCRFLGMDFRLQLRRNFCSGGTGFESRKVRVLPGPLSQAFLERINDVSGGKHSGLLKHDEYELGKTSVPLKERVEGLILLAEKDIRWCKGKVNSHWKRPGEECFLA